VFCYKGSAAHEEMRQACFDYLRLGGWYSAGPVSLLSGLNPRPSVLVMHFFAVAVFGVGRLLMPRPTLRCFSHSIYKTASCHAHVFQLILAADIEPQPIVEWQAVAGRAAH
jgi:squalene monooxygenase